MACVGATRLGRQGLPKTLYNRWKWWGDMGVVDRMVEGLACEGGNQKTIMFNATYLKVTVRLQACGQERGA